MTTTNVLTAPADDWIELASGSQNVLIDIYSPRLPDTAAIIVRVAGAKPGVEINDGLIVDEERGAIGLTGLVTADRVWGRSLAAPLRTVVVAS